MTSDPPKASPETAPYRPAPMFAAVSEDLADQVEPADFPEATIRYRNQRWAEAVGLGDLSDADWIKHFARFDPLPGNQQKPLAMRYHGHQFRSYNPDLGDGRGFLFGQALDGDGRLLDFGTKGSGQTPYSRFGDGRLTLKGGVREALATEMLEALGVYTSKTFSLIETGEQLTRNDEPSPTRSAVMVRLQHSHIRFGAFQRHAYHDRADLITKLIDHCVDAYYPSLAALEGEDRAIGLFTAIISRSATLAASWMAAGFVHGVMNTDNMNVTGESFDYGPFRFLPHSDPGFTAAYFDRTGLYAFGRQPGQMIWNLQQLGGALTVVASTDKLTEALKTFEPAYQVALRDRTFACLGVTPGDLKTDLEMLSSLFAWMTETKASWPQVFFDLFCGEASADRMDRSPIANLYKLSNFWGIRAALFERTPNRPERLKNAYFEREAPESLLIDEIEALWAKIADDDDWSGFETKLSQIGLMREALDIAPDTFGIEPARAMSQADT